MEGGGKREQSRKTTTRAGVSTSILLATVDPSGAGSVPRKRERGEEEYRSTRRKIPASGNERCIGGLEIEIARQDVNDLGKKRKETRGRGKIERNGKSGIRETRGGTVRGKGRH